MVTIHVARGLRFVIFLDDHKPAHMHVFGARHAKIDIAGRDGPTLIWADGFKRSDVKRALQIVAEQQAEFLARCRTIHG